MEEGGLSRRRKGRQKVLWNRAEDGNHKRNKNEEKTPKTGSGFSTGSQESKKAGIGLVDRKDKTCPVENQSVPNSPPKYARMETGLFSTGPKKCGT